MFALNGPEEEHRQELKLLRNSCWNDMQEECLLIDGDWYLF